MKKPKPPKSFQEVESYIAKNKLNVDTKIFWNYFVEGDWHDKFGKPVLNWKQKLWTWHGRDKRTQQLRIEKRELETYKARIREQYQEYLENKSTAALRDIHNDGGQRCNLTSWLIDEIITKRGKK